MKVVIPGGSGQVGTILARSFHADGHEVVVLSRTAVNARWRTAKWNLEKLDGWEREFDGADVVINLAGRSVNCRYTPENRKEILESRVRSVEAVGAVIALAKHPPKVWLQASTATIYAHSFDEANDEYIGKIGGSEPDAPETWRFSIDVATAWENAFDNLDLPSSTRRIKLRSAMTMSPDDGGIFDTLLRLVRCGLGGKSGDGRQYISWIHERDFVSAVRFLIEQEEIQGTVNVSSPVPLPNEEFMAILRKEWGIRFGLPAASWMLEIGAVFLRTETELILKSRRVVPRRLLDAGFEFQYPQWNEAARELCTHWRLNHQRSQLSLPTAS